MGTGLKSNKGRGTACLLSSGTQGMNFGMRFAGTLVPTFANHLVTLNQYTAYARIRVSGVKSALR
jgi:hypothetical protein